MDDWIITNMRNMIIDGLIAHAEGHITKHKANIEVYLKNPVGVGEHPDILEAIEKELDVIAKYDDHIAMLKNIFKCQYIDLEIKKQTKSMTKLCHMMI